MPIIKSAIKKMRQDRQRTATNRAKRESLKKAIKLAESNPTAENVSKAFSALDKAAKTNLIPKGRADRKKSRLPKVSATKYSKSGTASKTTKKAAKNSK